MTRGGVGQGGGRGGGGGGGGGTEVLVAVGRGADMIALWRLRRLSIPSSHQIGIGGGGNVIIGPL